MTDLFDHAAEQARAFAPLAERLRPETLDAIIGQQHLLGPEGVLRKLIQKDRIPSMILWGPPGVGKTTLAQAIAHQTRAEFHALSAVSAGTKEIREVVEKAKANQRYYQKPTILFIDEIHRFNKTQQDALLPHVEKGVITLIGATTENPSFEVIGALLSRTRVFVLEALSEPELNQLVDKGLSALERGIEEDARAQLISLSQGDARNLLNLLEVAAELREGDVNISLQSVEDASQQRALRYDKDGEEHYNLISAFIKSMRASQPDAALYYLARMFESGEEGLFLARRMVIFASEDIGLADPQALPLAMAAMQAYDFVGRAEGWIPLAHAASYLALAPKSNASYQGYQLAKAEIAKSGSLPAPLHLRNAPTKLMKSLGYGKGYRYAHSDPEGSKEMECLPEELKGKRFLSFKSKT